MQNMPPINMRAVVQESAGGSLSVRDIDIPVPGDGEVLIKMYYAPINPSDLSQLQGTFTPLPNYPFTPGIEGSGIVVSHGKGIIASLRSGKRVACTSKKGNGGSWAEYMLTSATNCIPLSKNMNPDSASMMLVNPMTAVAFIDLIKSKKQKTVVNNAAGSSLGIMFQKMCKKNGIELINIVRNNKKNEELKKAGAEIILDSSGSDFMEKLREITHKKNVRLFFDAIGGKQTEIIAEVSPAGSKIILYARLSEESFTIDPRTILQHGKIIDGFSLPLYTKKKSIFSLLKMTGKVKSLLSNELSSSISQKYALESVNNAISNYRNNMSAGKVILDIRDLSKKTINDKL